MPNTPSQENAVGSIQNAYQASFILVDFGAALLFVIGSILFFDPQWTYPGTWCFLVGSVFFAVKPTLRLARFLHLRKRVREAELSFEQAFEGRHFF